MQRQSIMAAFCHAKKADGGHTMADAKTEKQKVQEITEKLEQRKGH